MQRIVLIGWIILFLIRATALQSQTHLSYDDYKRLAGRYFEVQNFDSCLYYNYILANRYLNAMDTAGLINTWYTIGTVNLLQKKQSRALAAQFIAGQYIHGNKVICHAPALQDNFRYTQQLLEIEHYTQNNEPVKAKEILFKFLCTLKEKGDTNWFGYAKANMLMGDYFFNRLDYFHSIGYYETAIRIYEANQIYHTDWIRTYRYFLDALLFSGQREKRDSCFKRIEMSNLIKRNRTGYYFIKGDYNRATSDEDALDAYLQAYSGIDVNDENKVDIKKEIIYYFVKNAQYDKAIEWFKKLEVDRIDNLRKIMAAYSYIKTGDTARGYILIRDLKFKDAGYYYSTTLYWLAKFYFETKNYDRAEMYYKQYLQFLITHGGNIHYTNSFAYSALGLFYWYGKTDYERSLRFYHKTVFALTNEDAPDDFYQMPNINKSISDIEFSRALNNKAQAFYEVSKLGKTKSGKLRNLKACLANLELSLTVAHRYKMSLRSDEQRYGYADIIQYRYPYIINVCIELYRNSDDYLYAYKAYEYAEKSKSSLLLSTMRGVNVYKMHLIPENLKKMEDQLWTKAELMSRYLSESYQSPELNRIRIDQYNSSLNVLRHQQDSLINIFKTKYPAYYNARYNAEVVGMDSMQKLLKPDEAMLEYSISSDKLVIFLLTHNEFKVFTDTVGKLFFADIEAYRKVLSNYSFDYRNSTTLAFARSSNHLYNQLIKPVEPFLPGKRLLIIPDDVLNQIPFETLVTEQPPDNGIAGYRKLPYLIGKYIISYNYSGTFHAMNYKALTYRNSKLLAVAPEYEKLKLKQLIAKDLPGTQGDSVEIYPIPGIYKEVKGIHRLFGGKILMKKEATEENFKKIAGQYEILHLATHGVTNNEYPMFSKLVFTVGRDSVNDGLLNAYEIYDMRINAPLVVLSACNTGYGKLHKGEGIISLSRGFFTAGAKSIVMTLWPVQDEPSSKIMNNFYTNLAAKQNIADALYNAKLDYLKQSDGIGAHPSLWAGYIILGNASVTFVPYKPKESSYYYWIGIGLLAIIGIIYRKRLKNLFHLL